MKCLHWKSKYTAINTKAISAIWTQILAVLVRTGQKDINCKGTVRWSRSVSACFQTPGKEGWRPGWHHFLPKSPPKGPKGNKQPCQETSTQQCIIFTNHGSKLLSFRWDFPVPGQIKVGGIEKKAKNKWDPNSVVSCYWEYGDSYTEISQDSIKKITFEAAWHQALKLTRWQDTQERYQMYWQLPGRDTACRCCVLLKDCGKPKAGSLFLYIEI